MSFGEAASAITIDISITDFFKLFYKDFPEASLEWFVYSYILEFELPASFRLQNIYSYAEEFKILSILVRPSLLPVEIRHCREKPPTSYEFYFPSIVARHMSFGQLPPVLFFADKVKPREVVAIGIEYNRILHFEQSLLPEAISGWDCTPFTSTAYDYWWQEWSQHIFNAPVSTYCSLLDLDFEATAEVYFVHYISRFLYLRILLTYFDHLQDLASLTPPLINYDIWCPNPRLGNDAPSLRALMKKPASNLHDNQPILILKRKQPAASQKRTSKKIKAAPSKQLKSLANVATEVTFC